MKKNRTQYAILNSTVALGIQILKIILTFINRTVFIYFLGIYYLGLNGLFSSILSVLSLADLGVSSAMAYSLYKPLAEGNHKKVAAFSLLFKKVYNIIALTILTFGIILTFFLKYLTKEQITNEFIIIYYLFLFNSVISYLFTYKRILLEANQKKYIITTIDFLVLLFGSILQILVILIYKNYYLYLVIAIIITLTSNILISIIVNREYSNLKNRTITPISTEEKKEFTTNVKGLFFSKIGEVVVNGTDNILMSSFISITAVALYSNYNMITYTATTTITIVLTAVMGSIGNLIHNKNTNLSDILSFFKKFEFLVFSISYFSSIGIFIFINIIIEAWLSTEYLLSKNVVLLISINFFITIYRLSSLTLINGYGLFSHQKTKALCEASLNLIFSVLLVKYTPFGIAAVLIGTLISSLLTVVWYEPYSLFKFGLKISVKNYYRIMFSRYSYMFTTFIGFYYFIDFINYNKLLNIIISILSFSTIVIIYFISNHKKNEFIYFRDMFLSILKKRIL